MRDVIPNCVCEIFFSGTGWEYCSHQRAEGRGGVLKPNMAQPAQQPTFEGTLLKAGDHTSLLRERFFSLSNSCLSYWENEADARAGASPRGSGRVIDTEEWWPQRKSIFSQLDLTARASNESEDYDGCRFLVRLLPTEGGRLCCYKLVATSPAERMKWMAALVDGKHRPSSGTPFPTGDSPEASGDSGGDSHRGSGAASAGAAAPAMDMHAEVLAEVLAALPGVWATWNVYGSEKQVLQARQQADEEYMLLHRRAPDCWQLLQDRGNFYLRIGELRRADSDFTAALALYPTRPELWNDRSACRSQMCRHADALADTQEALRLRPTFAQALVCSAVHPHTHLAVCRPRSCRARAGDHAPQPAAPILPHTLSGECRPSSSVSAPAPYVLPLRPCTLSSPAVQPRQRLPCARERWRGEGGVRRGVAHRPPRLAYVEQPGCAAGGCGKSRRGRARPTEITRDRPKLRASRE